jgi:hypothetical protein
MITWIISFTAGRLLSQSLVKDTAHLESKALRLVIANNEAYGNIHKAGYSGIAELYFKNEDGKNFFVPTYAGLNYEHIFSGDEKTYEWNMYESRQAPMTLVRKSTRKVELRQARTKNWPLKTVVSYELKNNIIDFVFSATPLKDAWKKHGYVGIFFASYINAPLEKGIHFIAKKNADINSKHEWVYHLPEIHGSKANHKAAASDWKPAIDTPGFPISLVSGYSDLEYVYPFYYGLSDDHVFIVMFDNPGKDGEINFAQSPDGGGDDNPAWDFIFFRKNYRLGKKFSFRARTVFKKFQGRDDVIKTYENWSGKKVIKP